MFYLIRIFWPEFFWFWLIQKIFVKNGPNPLNYIPGKKKNRWSSIGYLITYSAINFLWYWYQASPKGVLIKIIIIIIQKNCISVYRLII
jgi:hypothetical protein